MFLEEISRQRRDRTRRQQFAENLQYRQGMREISAGKRRIQALIDEYTAQAVDAEQGGQHDRAVRLALEARRLKQYLANSGGISAALESAHAVAAANRALSEILQTSGRLAEQTTRLADPAALGEVQAGMLTVSENMKLMMEQNDMLMEDMRDDGAPDSEAGEAFLSQIMRSQSREQHKKLLQDTHRQLDRLQRARAAEK